MSPDIDSLALAQLSWRLQRLHSVSAPERLRRTGLARALATPPARRRHVVPLAPSHQRLLLASRRLAATAAAVFLLAFGTFAASAASMPESLLYPVKLLVEDARVAVAPVEDKPLIYVEQATRRLEETDALITDGRISAAERTASDAAKRIESAQAAAQQVPAPAPQVREAIGSTLAQYRSVSESLVSHGGTPPPVTGVQAGDVARAPSAPGSIAPGERTASPESEPNPDPALLEVVAAPGRTADFAAIPAAGAPEARPGATPAAVARVNAPSPNNFGRIDLTPVGRVVAPSASGVVAIEGDGVTAQPTGSAVAQTSPTTGPRASATPTPTARPSVTAARTPTAVATSPAAPVPSATPGLGAPNVGFTPIPIDSTDPLNGRQLPVSERTTSSGGRLD